MTCHYVSYLLRRCGRLATYSLSTTHFVSFNLCPGEQLNASHLPRLHCGCPIDQRESTPRENEQSTHSDLVRSFHFRAVLALNLIVSRKLAASTRFDVVVRIQALPIDRSAPHLPPTIIDSTGGLTSRTGPKRISLSTSSLKRWDAGYATPRAGLLADHIFLIAGYKYFELVDVLADYSQTHCRESPPPLKIGTIPRLVPDTPNAHD
jgi:hypothetical protein